MECGEDGGSRYRHGAVAEAEHACSLGGAGVYAGDVVDIGEGEGGYPRAKAGALLALLQCDLEALTLSNLLGGAAQMRRPAIDGGGDFAVHGHPARKAVGLDDFDIDLVGRAVGDDAVEHRLMTCAAGWSFAVQYLLDSERDVGRIHAPVAVVLLGPVDGPRRDLPRPVAEAGDAVGLLQALLDLLALGNVLHGAAEACGSAAAPGFHLSAHCDPAIAAGRVNDLHVELVGDTVFDRALDCRLQHNEARRSIVGLDRGVVDFAVCWISAKDAIGFVGPGDLVGEDIPIPGSYMSDAAGFGQVSLHLLAASDLAWRRLDEDHELLFMVATALPLGADPVRLPSRQRMRYSSSYSRSWATRRGFTREHVASWRRSRKLW